MRTTFTTTTQRKAFGKATKLAALADPARNTNEAERASALAKLIELCTRHDFTLAEFGLGEPVASPEAGEAPKPEATAKPKRTRAKPEAAKPATPADKRDAERERALANRAHIARHYAGPSAASHGARAPKLAEALARVASPVQRAKSASERDESGLALALKHADKAGTFCPVSATFDLGVLSRLASLGHITVAGDRLALTKTGLSLARIVTKRAAA
jgi:hypothetical protein